MGTFYLDGDNNRYYLGVAQIYYNNKIYVRPDAALYTSLGFTEVTVQAKPDPRFYIISGPNNDGSWTSTARDIATVREGFLEAGKLRKRRELLQSIEPVLSALENGNTVPADWLAYRTQVRSTLSDYLADITAAGSIPVLETVIEEDFVLLEAPDELTWITVYISSANTSTLEFVYEGGTAEEYVNPYVRALRTGWEIIDSRISDSDATTVIAAGTSCTNINTTNGETTWSASTTGTHTGEFQIKLGPAAY